MVMVLNIEQALGERYPQLFNGPSRPLTRSVIPFLRWLLHEREVNRFLQEHRDLHG